MRRKKIEGILLLFTAAIIWGNSFVAQTSAAGALGTFTFNACRSFAASMFLTVVLLLRNAQNKRNRFFQVQTEDTEARRNLWKYGVICGIVLFFGFGLQQGGIAAYPPETSAAGRAGFLTSVQVVIVPLIEWSFGKKPRSVLFVSLVGILCGMYLLCMSNGLGGFYLGDLLVLLCACTFGIYVVLLGKCRDQDSISLCAVQFLICGILSFIAACTAENCSIADIYKAVASILYAGILSSGVAYVLQAIGQRYVEPTVVTMIISLQSVVAAIAGWVILHEHLSGREIWGCVLVFSFVLLAQMDIFENKNKKRMRGKNDAGCDLSKR